MADLAVALMAPPFRMVIVAGIIVVEEKGEHSVEVEVYYQTKINANHAFQ